MNDFRAGKSNILIATSIGEEGIDVGEVELIVCFDISTSNPTRFVQRIGRTGRKKNGDVIMMVTEGREQQLLREVLSNKDQINKKLLRSPIVQQSLYKHSPRLVPTEFKPKCIQTYVKEPSDDEELPSPKGKKSINSKLKTPEKGIQDLRKFFQKKPKEMSKEDKEFFEDDTNMTQVRPGVQTQQRIVQKLDKMKNLFKDLQSPAASQTQRSLKKSPQKMNNSQGSIKNYFKDCSSSKNQTQESLNESELNNNELNESTINLCSDDSAKHVSDPKLSDNESFQKDSFDKHASAKDSFEKSSSDKQAVLNKIDPERLQKLEKFLSMTFTTPEVLKRAEINDLGYHLKSKELSREMKLIFLRQNPEYIKECLEKIQVLNAVYDSDTSSFTEEEKSIREIYDVIVDLFGGLENVEKYLDECEFEKFKSKYLEGNTETDDEEVTEGMDEFQKKLDDIFEDLDDGKEHDNHEWIKERFKETWYYKEHLQQKSSSNVQESMVYETFAEHEDEDNTMNNLDDFTITESKYCSQWQDFNKKDITFKSTPLQSNISRNITRGEHIKKTSLLSKLEETKEEHEIEDIAHTSTDSKHIQKALEMLEKKLKDNSLNENTKTINKVTDINENSLLQKKISSPQSELDELENIFKSRIQEYEKRKQQTEAKISSTNNFDDFNFGEDDDLIMAATEAELKFTQNHSKQDPNKTPDLPHLNNKELLNSSAKLTPPSLNSTPDIDLSNTNLNNIQKPSITSTLPTPPDVSLQKELDIDMEAFMDPFPEEQELIKTSQPAGRRGSFKENATTSSLVRESPDLFADDHMQSPIKKPIASKKPTLASKLSSKVNIQKCQSSLNPATSFKSPQKPLFSTQNPVQLLNSPSSRLTTDKQKCEKSPSLFDMYLKNTKGKGKLPKSLVNTSTFCAASVNNNDKKNSPAITASQQNESLIVVRSRSGKASKRKIFDSDSEQEEDEKKVNNSSVLDSRIEEEDEDASDFEEIPVTQGVSF